MSDYEPCQYLCEIVDAYDDETTEPDWSRVPEFKREQVRQRWQQGQMEKLKPERWHLFGPQIPFYQKQSKYRVTVIGRCVDVCAPTCPNLTLSPSGLPDTGGLDHEC